MRKLLKAVAEAVLTKARPAAPAIVRDLVGGLGCVMLVVGAGEIYHPAGHLAAGLMLLAYAIRTARPPS